MAVMVHPVSHDMHPVSHDSQDLDLRVEEMAVVVIVVAVVDGGQLDHYIKEKFTCRKSSQLITFFGALLIKMRAGVTVLLEWVGQERTVVGWESRWTEECVRWVGDVLH